MKKNKKITKKSKSQKKVELQTTNALATGVFKARKWSWVFSAVALLALVIYVGTIAYEYLGSGTCGFCPSFRAHMGHYIPTFFYLFIAWIVASALVFLLARWPKRSLTVTAAKVCFKSGRTDIRIPLSALERVEATKKGTLKITVPLKKFKFKHLQNANDLCQTLLLCMNPSATLSTVVTPPTVEEKKEEPLSAGKIRYFQKLYNDGVITEVQFNEYITQALAADK